MLASCDLMVRSILQKKITRKDDVTGNGVLDVLIAYIGKKRLFLL
jgi:hypothetical protein